MVILEEKSYPVSAEALFCIFFFWRMIKMGTFLLGSILGIIIMYSLTVLHKEYKISKMVKNIDDYRKK